MKEFKQNLEFKVETGNIILVEFRKTFFQYLMDGILEFIGNDYEDELPLSNPKLLEDLNSPYNISRLINVDLYLYFGTYGYDLFTEATRICFRRNIIQALFKSSDQKFVLGLYYYKLLLRQDVFSFLEFFQDHKFFVDKIKQVFNVDHVGDAGTISEILHEVREHCLKVVEEYNNRIKDMGSLSIVDNNLAGSLCCSQIGLEGSLFITSKKRKKN